MKKIDIIVIDIEGKYYEKYKDKLVKKGTNVIQVDLQDMQENGVYYNPFASLENNDNSIFSFVDAIFGKDLADEANDPFLIQSERNLMVSCIKKMFNTCTKENWNFATLLEILKNANNDMIPECPMFMTIKVHLEVRLNVFSIDKIASFLNNSSGNLCFKNLFANRQNSAVFIKISGVDNYLFPIVRAMIADAWITKIRMGNTGKKLFFLNEMQGLQEHTDVRHVSVQCVFKKGRTGGLLRGKSSLKNKK